ncbi:hypothetical protein [Candidatus Pollutiaquabacter sp.]|uniref:hypothetical protein n=1 Tax=Candidatus Pollutiaquabacter sp. TaxID=3416354 RepID=UPI003CBD24AC|nr:hypothetical protein [Bacteroidota bacterium]
MDYRHFHELLAGKAAPQAGALQELLRDHPYCQAGHLLLVKAFHDQQHIRYEPALRTAAAHQPDRRVLYRIVHDQVQASSDSVFREPVTAAPESPFLEAAKEESPLLIGAQAVDSTIPAGIFSDHYVPEQVTPEPMSEQPPVLPEPSREAIINPHIQEEPISLAPVVPIENDDPREVLRRRLAELLGDSASTATVRETKVIPEEPAAPTILNDTPKTTDDFLVTAPAGMPEEPIEEAESGITKVTDAKPAEPVKSEDIVDAESEALEDPVFREGLSYALEETLLHELERLPELSVSPEESHDTAKSPETETTEPKAVSGNFFAWLRSKQVDGFGAVEAVHAEDDQKDEREPIKAATLPGTVIPAKATDEQSALIDKFIAEEPRIVPSKTEFFNPVVQAKRSVEEHEDIVSETLAGIYAAQGNLLKARSAYQRLGLLHPEKSAYFAALVREIDEKLNSSSSEDL